MKNISMNDAARMAGCGLVDMRGHAQEHGLETSDRVFGEYLDRDKFLSWLDSRDMESRRKRRDLEDREYSEWVESNGEFLLRFLRENRLGE